MIVKNPTNSDLEVKIEGIEYIAPAMGEAKNVLPEHAEHWKRYIHQFVEVVAEKAEKVALGTSTPEALLTVTPTVEANPVTVVVPAPKVVVKAPPKKK